MINMTHSIATIGISPNDCWETLTAMHLGRNFLEWHPFITAGSSSLRAMVSKSAQSFGSVKKSLAKNS